MKKFTLLLFMGIFSISCSGQMVKSNTYNLMLKTLLSHTVTEMSVDSLAKVKENVTLLDAREKPEYEVSHIAGATYVGYDHFDSTAVLKIDRQKPVVVYCSVGYRSEKVSEKLRLMGFKDVSNLYGGIFEWKNAGYPVKDTNGETEKVHAFDKVWGVWLKKGEKVYDK